MDQQHQPLSLEDAAMVLKVSVPTIQSMIDRGLLEAHGEGDQANILYDDLITFMRNDQRTLMEEGYQPADQGLLEDTN